MSRFRNLLKATSRSVGELAEMGKRLIATFFISTRIGLSRISSLAIVLKASLSLKNENLRTKETSIKLSISVRKNSNAEESSCLPS